MSDSLLTVFPTTQANWQNENMRSEGLLLRDYFAASVVSGVLSSPGASYHFNNLAEDAYKIADAMLRARLE